MTKRRRTRSATAAAGEVLLHGTGAAGDDEAPAGRSAVARRLAKARGISVGAAKRQVRDLLRVQLGTVPEGAGRRVRKTWERTIGALAERTGVDTPDEAVQRVRAFLDRLRARVLRGGLGGKSGTGDDRIWAEVEAGGIPTATVPASAAGHGGTGSAASAPSGAAGSAPAADEAYALEPEPGARGYAVEADPGTRGDPSVEAEAEGGLGGHSGTRDDR